jgi:hypothetical protein
MINNYRKKSFRVFARKTEINVLSQKESDIFYNRTHIMGSTKARHVSLSYNDKPIMLMSFKIRDGILKIERMSSELGMLVVGGFSKLIRYLERNYSFNQIHYWVDLRYGTGNFLLNNNFILKRDTLGWKWTDFKTTYNRLRCRANMDERGLSEREHAEELGWVKIYDAGQRLYIRKMNGKLSR